jgi:hypothetical protein
MRMMDIHPAVSQKAIARNRWVKTVDVSRYFPNTVVICVHEREPVALVCAGGVYYMDKDGTLLPLFDKTYSNLPVVTGVLDVRLDSVMCVGAQACTRIKAFFEAAKNEDASFAKRISQVDFMANQMVRLHMEDMPTTIELTDANAPVILHRLRQLVETVQNRPDALPHSINLCYANMAYIR